jgi:hypothetical protein
MSQGGKRAMKKVIWLVAIALFFVSMGLLTCAPAKKTVITKSDLSALKGKWQGWTTFSSFPGNPILTTMEINNDTVPVQGKINLINLPQRIADNFPGVALPPGNTVTIGFANGKITDQGTLIGQSGENFLELTYFAGERPRFDGWFYYYGMRGTVELTKK